MADRLNISIKHYSEVERGIAGLSIENIINVCDILGISIDYLLQGKKLRRKCRKKYWKCTVHVRRKSSICCLR